MECMCAHVCCSAVMVQQCRDVSGCASATQSDDDSQMSSFSTRNLSVLFISLLLDLVAFTVILPLLPSLIDYYGSHDDEVQFEIAKHLEHPTVKLLHSSDN